MKKTFASLLLLLLPSALPAADFNTIVDEVARNNPSMQSKRTAALAETMARVADNRLPAAEVGFSHVWSTPAEAGTKMSVEVSQGFDWPGVYGARRRAARAAKAASGSRLQADERALRLQTRAALFDIIDANLRCDLLERIVANLDSMHTAAHTMLEVEQITELDHRKVALEEIAMKQQLADAHASRADALAVLATLNGGALPDGALDLRAYPEQTLLPLADYLKLPAPELEAARSEVEALRLDSKAARLGLYPGFSVGYIFEREAGVTFNGFSLGLQLPSPSSAPQAKALLLEAEARELRAAEADQARRAEITATHATAEQIGTLLADYRRALGSGNYEELLRRSLNGGQITYADYFTELNFYLEAKLAHLSQILRRQNLLAKLNSLIY